MARFEAEEDEAQEKSRSFEGKLRKAKKEAEKSISSTRESLFSSSASIIFRSQ